MPDDQTWAALVTPEGRALVASLTPWDDRRGLAAIEAARREPTWAGRPHIVSAAATQARLRTRAAARFPGPPRWWTSTGLEQATCPELALRHADRFRAAGCRHVLDLGCGVGSDALALAAAGLAVTAVDRDPGALAALRASAADAGLAGRIEVVRADVQHFVRTGPAAGSGIFLDPSRRDDSGRRLLLPERWSPPWSWVRDLAAEHPHTGAKVAPGIAHGLLPEDASAQWTSLGGTLLEAGVWWGRLRGTSPARRSATVLPGRRPAGAAPGLATSPEPGASGAPAEATISDAGGIPTAPVGPIGGWVLEPDPAVIRAGLVAVLCPMLETRLIHPKIAYLTCNDEPVPSPFATRWEVRARLPFKVTPLRRQLRRSGFGNVVVKKRGVEVVPEQLRAKLNLGGDGPTATLLLTRTDDGPLALLVEPLDTLADRAR